MAPPLLMVPCKTLDIRFGGAMVGLFALAAICHHIKNLSNAPVSVSGLKLPPFDEERQQSTDSWRPQ
jgi:hypothetical protein